MVSIHKINLNNWENPQIWHQKSRHPPLFLNISGNINLVKSFHITHEFASTAKFEIQGEHASFICFKGQQGDNKQNCYHPEVS